MKNTLSRNTVQVPDLIQQNRRYRNKEHNLGKIPAYAKDMVKEEIIDYVAGKQYTTTDEKKSESYGKLVKALETCGMNYVHLQAGPQEVKLARIHCNQEFCPTCGQNDSALHKKRAGRAQDRLLWSKMLGYMIFTLPRSISDSNPDRDTLVKLSKKTWEITKKYFNTPGGVTRIHFMGEDPAKLHIHFNVLFPLQSDRGAVSEECLAEIRKEWTDFLNSEFNLEIPVANIFYKFAIEAGKQIHKIKYVFRPVVTPDKFITLSEKDRDYILSFKGWHNTRWYGKLANACYKKYFEELKIELPEDYEHVAPISGEKYHMMGIVPRGDVNEGRFTDEDGHGYQMAPIDNNTYVDLATWYFLKEKRKE